MKKKEDDFHTIRKPKNESLDEYRSDGGNNRYATDIELQRHTLKHPIKKESMNGVIEIDDDSSSDGENDVGSNDNRPENSRSDVKKEENKPLFEEKIIADDDGDNDNENNDDDDDDDNENPKNANSNEMNNLFANDSSDEQCPYISNATNVDGDDTRENFVEADSMDDSKSPHDSRSSNDNARSEHGAGESDDNDEEDDDDDATAAKDRRNIASTESADRSDNADEIEHSDDNSRDDSTSNNVSKDETRRDSETADSCDAFDKLLRVKAPSNDEQPSKTTDEPDKDDDTEYGVDNKRPSSRESIASSASSSSERTLTIRSASQVNKMVSSSSDVYVKTEMNGGGGGGGDRIDKPGISVLNPSQLGINVVPNTSFNSPAEPLMNYMPPGLSNGNNPFQCDICETTFADSIVLEDHKANAGHYRCHFSSECSTYVFSNITELTQHQLTQHQQTYHGVVGQSPVQQLQHQVQNLPVRYQLEQSAGTNYQTMPQYTQNNVPPARNNVPPPPSMYASSQHNISHRQNPNNNLRIQYSSVRGQVPMGNQTSQATKRGPAGPPTRMVMPTKRRWNGDMDCKVVSVQKPDNNDDVVAQLSKSITITTRQENQKKNETAAVASMLATRGITVSQVPAKPDVNSNAVTMLNLNSAVSLIPTNKTSNFAVPHGRVGAGRPVTSSPSNPMHTVDLTGSDGARNRAAANRSGTSRFTCQICDRNFYNADHLNQHMVSHRSGTRKQLPYRCGSCGAQYPNQQSLIHHRQTCKIGVTTSTNEMVIPVVDLKQPGALHKLQLNGFNHVIPVNALGSQSSNGTFGIPILPLSSGGVTLNMTNCGISNILPIGPLKTLTNMGR